MTEREWREAIDMRASVVSLGLVLLSAALLRLWNVHDAAIAPQELEVIGPVLQMLHTGRYHPAALTHPALPVYIYTAVSVLHFIWGALTGVWRSVAEFGPAQVIAWGRVFSALLGLAVVAMIYQIGMRWGARHALLGAGLMAVLPMHVGASREVSEGSLVAFFVTLVLLLSLSAIERPRRGVFAATGACAGLAAASAYPGGLALLMPLTAAWMTRSDEGPRGWRALASVLAAIVAFLIVTPHAVTDIPAFLNGIGAAGTPARFTAMSRVQLAAQLVGALQWPGLLLALAGLVLGTIRAVNGPGHTRWTLLVSFPVLFFAIVAWHGATSDTILLPMLPSMAVIAAIAVISGVSLLRRFDIPRFARTALIAALTVVAVLPPAVIAIQLVGEATAGRGR